MPSLVTHHAGPTAVPKPLAGQTPPRPRGRAHEGAKEPPAIIVATGEDSKQRPEHHVQRFLGEGGFARVYETIDSISGVRYAAKVVAKKAIESRKNKTKLYAEIKIHRALTHPNIVNFVDCFEDHDNVYLLLELCNQGSMMEHLRRRGNFTVPEARLYMAQLIGAAEFMHNHRVIHRDLKLGNLFLDENMNVKVGDFGLAALLSADGERKKTICGTPNYIAPEVLFDTANGHSFEVDVWSIGVILYTLLIGKPPFQTKDVKVIYKRIKANEYEFPPSPSIPVAARELIGAMLSPSPDKRPALSTIFDHSFFSHPFPRSIPQSASNSIPNFDRLTKEESRSNFKRLRLLLEAHSSKPLDPSRARGTLGPSAAVQAREFEKAVQPGSPISTLLKSAREPLVYTKDAAPVPPPKEINKRSGTMTEISRKEPLQDRLRSSASTETMQREDKLNQQKARLVRTMAKPSSLRNSGVPDENVKKGRSFPVASSSRDKPSSKGAAFESTLSNIVHALQARKSRAMNNLPKDEDLDLTPPKVFIVSWLDYCNKYGMGYALTDGSVGVYFNDSTSMVLSATKSHFDYIAPKPSTSNAAGPSQLIRRNYNIDSPPEDLSTKFYLLRHFENYMLDQLYGERPYTYVEKTKTKGLDFVQKYLRTKAVILFKLTGDLLQFNFADHTKVLLSSSGLLVTFIDEEYELRSWSLSTLMAKCPLSSREPDLAKDDPSVDPCRRALLKLRICREMLYAIVNKSVSQPSSREVPVGPAVAVDRRDQENIAPPRIRL